ncbi:Sugar ABC transporter substrate-binding protein OS=Streptomyces antimycoticus OX=68175 GN=SANT12839_084250 PE=4 SV=1 [Streptomyces antimycoticus]
MPFYAKNGSLDGYAAEAGVRSEGHPPSMRQSLTAEDGKLYAEPFYGESRS